MPEITTYRRLAARLGATPAQAALLVALGTARRPLTGAQLRDQVGGAVSNLSLVAQALNRRLDKLQAGVHVKAHRTAGRGRPALWYLALTDGGTE